MALLRRFLNQSHTIYLKPSSYSIPLKPLPPLLHPSITSQGLTPSLLTPPDLEKSEIHKHFNPKTNFTSNHYAEEMFWKIIEQCNAHNKLLEECGTQRKILECSESRVLGKPKEGVEIWADSVKKKRRKKMNKHKYKKLRKRLRRKTKK